MTLSEWNSVLDYAEKSCKRIRSHGIAANTKPYTMYDDRRGISIRVLDQNGDIFQTYRTGIWDTVREFEISLDAMASRIISEC